MTEKNNFQPVAISKCTEYDPSALTDAIIRQFEALRIGEDDFRGKKIAVKPNLVAKRAPEVAATVHPAMLEAVAGAVRHFGGGEITLAESPGGPFIEPSLRMIYDTCGMTAAAEKCGVKLNFDTTFREIAAPDGVLSKMFNIITPIADCDVLIDLCKLKSHTLTKMSGATKNLFGTVPGIQKFEMHARFPEPEDFCGMIVDLCACLCGRFNVIAVCDAVTGMDGNGPTGGEPHDIGAVLCCRSPFCLDVAAAKLIGFEGTVPMLDIAADRGLCPRTEAELTVLRDGEFSDIDAFRGPDSYKFNFLRQLPTMLGGGIAKFFEPHPEIDGDKCVGCGECVRSCPVHTITLVDVDKPDSKVKRQAQINHDNCIKCFCCQELCPFKAVKIRQNPLIKLIH